MRPITKLEANRPLVPTQQEAKEAVQILLRYLGEDPMRDGLLDTPSRVVAAFESSFAGYTQKPEEVLLPLFSEMGSYQDMVLVRSISFESHCEHHMMPMTGSVDLAYVPTQGIVGLSKFARLVDVFAKRLQTQERLTSQILEAFCEHVPNRGVAIQMKAMHSCMSHRGVKRHDAETLTFGWKGCFLEDHWQKRFLNSIA